MALSSYPEFTKSFTYLIEIETLAQDISTLNERKLELANALNKLRESLRAFQKTMDKHSFIHVGSLFIEHTTEYCITIVQEEIDKTKQLYDSTCADLRDKLLKMRDIEHQPQIKGIGLRPLSYAEAEGIMKNFGIK